MISSILGILGSSLLFYFVFFFWVSRKKFKLHLEVNDLFYKKDITNIKNETHAKALRKYNKSDINAIKPNLLLTCFGDFIVLIILPLLSFVSQLIEDAYDPNITGSLLLLGILVLAIKNPLQIRTLNKALDVLNTYPDRIYSSEPNMKVPNLNDIEQVENTAKESNEELIEVIISSKVKNNKLFVIKKINDLINTDLKKIKYIIDNTPSKLYSTYSQSEADNIKYELEKLDVKISLVKK